MGLDQLFKQLLRAFFAEFLRLFDPETAARLDLDTIEFRDTEAFTDIPQGERRTADLVAQVRTVTGAPELVLIHVEIQREREARFPWRMWQYCANRSRETVIGRGMRGTRDGDNWMSDAGRDSRPFR